MKADYTVFMTSVIASNARFMALINALYIASSVMKITRFTIEIDLCSLSIAPRHLLYIGYASIQPAPQILLLFVTLMLM